MHSTLSDHAAARRVGSFLFVFILLVFCTGFSAIITEAKEAYGRMSKPFRPTARLAVVTEVTRTN
jgi:hypothetical protein